MLQLQESKTLTITLPTHNTTKLIANQTTTVAQVISILRKNLPEPSEDGEEYGITLHESPEIIFEKHTKITKIPTDKFLFRKVQLKIEVQNDKGDSQIYVLDPILKVKEVILFIEHTNFIGSTYSLQNKPSFRNIPNRELYLHSNAKNTENVQHNHGLLLEFERPLLSYRLKQSDLLVLRNVQAKQEVWKNIAGDKEICIIIICPEHNQQKAILFPPTATFEEVLDRFLSKTNLNETKWFYDLFVNIDGRYQLMEPHWDILSFPLPTPAKLECKYKVREPRNHFGVDPLTLPFVNDNGFHVPEILVILKDMLLAVNGVEIEGIFRKAGLENEMISLKESLDAGKPIHSKNPHSIATLMKRWFKELPKRLFAHLDYSYADDLRCLNLFDLLSPLEQSLAFWLFDLLLTISDRDQDNKMSISNLSIVWGPGMVGQAVVDSSKKLSKLMDPFNETRLGVELLEKNLSYLATRRPLPRVNIKNLVNIKDDHVIHNIVNNDVVHIPLISLPKQTAICLYDNVAEDEGEISVKKGALVTVLEDDNKDWTLVLCGSSKGYLPRNYLKFESACSSESLAPRSSQRNNNNNNTNGNSTRNSLNIDMSSLHSLGEETPQKSSRSIKNSSSNDNLQALLTSRKEKEEEEIIIVNRPRAATLTDKLKIMPRPTIFPSHDDSFRPPVPPKSFNIGANNNNNNAQEYNPPKPPVPPRPKNIKRASHMV